LLCGDLPVLLFDDERTRAWLGEGITPPIFRIETGREVEALTSNTIVRVLRLGVPLILLFEAGAAKVTAFAGYSLQALDGAARRP
jgi:hypothetical protein